ncbi:MAG: phage tail tape measure protein [Planctomycetota bacterium]|nr:phage tail tape measure protein [Planctomycetota bacterium]
MGANVERSILLRLLSEVKIDNLKDSIDLLGKLEERVVRIRNLTRTPIDITPVTGSAFKAAEQSITSVTGALRNQISVSKSLNDVQLEGARNIRTALIQQFDAQGRLKKQSEEIVTRGPFGSGATISQTVVGGTVRKEKTALNDAEIQREGRLRERAISEDQAREERRIRENLALADQERTNRARIQKAIAQDEANRQRAATASQAEEDRRIKANLARLEQERAVRAAIQQKMLAEERKVEQTRAAEQRKAEADRQKALNVIDRAARPANLEEIRRRNAPATFQSLVSQPGSVVTSTQELNRTTGQLERVLQVTNETTGAYFKLNTQTKELTGGFREMGTEAERGGDTLQNAAGKVLLWTLATSAIFGTMRALREGLDVFQDYESATISLARVGRGFGDSQDEIVAGARRVSEEILNLKVQFGATGDEAQEAAVIFARLGLSETEVLEGVRTALLAANVAGVGAAEAAGLLAAAMQQFQLNVSDLPDLLNKLNTLENTTKVTTNDLLQAIGRGGAVIREAGGTLEEFAAITAVVSQATGRTGAEIGNAYKTIASRLADTNLQAQLFEKTGIGIRNIQGELKPIGELLGELVVKFQSLSAAEKAEITTSIAGIRQRNILQTTLDNYFQVQSQVIRQLKETSSAEAENALVVDTLEKKIASLKAAFERLAVAFANSGIADVLKLLIDALIGLLNGIDKFGTAGRVVVTLFALWVGAVVALTVAQTALGTAFAQSYNLIAASAGRVNAALAGFIGVQTAQQAANARTIASNEALAASYQQVAAGQRLTVFGGPAATGTAGLTSLAFSGAAAIVASPLAVAAGIGLGASAGITSAADKIRRTRPFEEDSASNRALKAASDRVRRQQNEVKAFEEQVSLAKTAVAALQEIEKAEAAGQADANQAQRTRLQIGQALVNTIGLEADAQERAIEGTLRAVDAAEALAKAKLGLSLATEALKDSLQQQLSKQLDEAGKLRRDIEEQKRFSKDSDSGILTGLQALLPFAPNDTLNFLGSFLTSGPKEAVKAQQKDLVELQKQIDETLRKLDEADQQKAFQQAFITVKALDDEMKRLSRSFDERFELEIDFEPDKLARANLELEKQRKLIQSIRSSSEFKNALTDPAASKDAREKIQKEEEKLNDLSIKARIAAAQKSFEEDKRVFDARYKLAQSLVKIQTDLTTKESRRPIAQKEAEIALDLRSLEILKQRVKILTEELASSRSGAAFGDFRQGVTQLNPAEFSAKNNELRAAKERIDDIEKSLEGKAVDLTVIRFETERKITEERVRQQEELRKQLGQMSDLDLIQTRIFAARISAGEDVGVSQEDFLLLPEFQRKFLQQQQELFPGVNIVPKLDVGLPDRAFERREELPKISKEEQALLDRFKDFEPFSRKSLLEPVGLVPKAVLPPPAPQDLLDELAPAVRPPAPPPELIRDLENRQSVQTAINTATIEASTVTVNTNGTEAQGAKFSAVPPAGALNLTVNLSGLDVPADQLANQISLQVRAAIQQLIDENVQRVQNPIKRPLNAPVRPRT